jgi:threonine aldolase
MFARNVIAGMLMVSGLAGAVAGLGVKPAELTWKAGVDVLSFGGTKNGCIAAEAVVFFNPADCRDFGVARQRAGHGFSKAWFIAAQFEAWLDGGHWLD